MQNPVPTKLRIHFSYKSKFLVLMTEMFGNVSTTCWNLGRWRGGCVRLSSWRHIAKLITLHHNISEGLCLEGIMEKGYWAGMSCRLILLFFIQSPEKWIPLWIVEAPAHLLLEEAWNCLLLGLSIWEIRVSYVICHRVVCCIPYKTVAYRSLSLFPGSPSLFWRVSSPRLSSQNLWPSTADSPLLTLTYAKDTF